MLWTQGKDIEHVHAVIVCVPEDAIVRLGWNDPIFAHTSPIITPNPPNHF